MGWTTLTSTHRVKIRKARYCEWCYRTWPVGSPMMTWTGVHSGNSPQRTYMCIVCNDYFDAHWDDDELPTEAFWVDDLERYNEFDIHHSLRLVVSDLPMVKDMALARELERQRRMEERMAEHAARKAKS